RQVFHGDHITGVDDTPAVLVREVATAPGGALIHTGSHFAPISPLRSALVLFGKAAMCFSQCLSSTWKKRGLAITSPVERAAKVVSPTSIPTCCPVSGSGVGSAHSHAKLTYHLPVLLRRMVAVLGVPSSGRCSTTLI